MKSSRKLKLLSLSVSLVLSLLLAEVIVRGAGYRPTPLTPEMFLPGTPYRLRPNFSNGNISIDSEGQRTVVNCRDPKTLLLGDSVVFGQGLRDSETIASQLGVANLGVPGYSSWNEYEALKTYPHEVDRVILIYVPNDVTFDNNHAGISRGGAELSQSLFHRTTNFIYRYWYTALLARNGLKAIIDKPSKQSFDWSALDYSMDAVQKIGELKPLSVGVYRDVSYYQDPGLKEYELRVAEALERRGIQYFVIRSHVDQLTESEIKVGWNDPHPSPQAARLIAADIAAYLEITVQSRVKP